MRKLVLGLLLALPGVASANFHFMQIEQVIGGVAGDTTQQAVQLRMRIANQNVVSQAQIVVVDANGANPVLLIDMMANVPNFQAGDRILIASPNYIAEQGVTADFTMAKLIPPSYFDGGQIQFLHDGGLRYWLLCWGNYSGSTTGEATNDGDGNFGPCAAPTLPFTGVQSLRFTGTAGAQSTTNLADYSLSTGAAVFSNNAHADDTVQPSIFSNGFE